jgi:hypothetical protein
MLLRKKYVGVVILIILFFNVNLMAQKLYFSNPRESVDIISKLLTEENWEQLSYYYYLENTDEEVIDSLKNGSYFIRIKRPEVAHPGGFWKYKNPFPPGFSYLSHREVALDTIKVEVTIEIDQGNDMIQQGLDSFYLKKSEKGYQLIL